MLFRSGGGKTWLQTPPELGFKMAAASGLFRGFLLGVPQFEVKGQLIGEEATRGSARGGLTAPGCGPALGRA